MNIPGQDVLSTSWHRVRDAGAAVGELAGHTLSDNALVRSLPKVKDFMATGAGLAIARRGAKVAIGAVRRNPVLAIGAAVALAAGGAVYLAAKKRREAAAAGTSGERAKPKRLTATSRRQAADASGERSRARATRQRKPRGDAEA